MNNNTHTTIVRAATLAVIFHAVPAYTDSKIDNIEKRESAGQQHQSRDREIEEIIVTAQRKQESLQDVPMALTALTNESMQKLGIRDMGDIGRQVPGLSVNDAGWGAAVFTLRGVGFNDQTFTATSTVGFYIDEINLPYSPMTRGSLFDISRVEALKGPQGTLYGRNTTAGLINFIPNAPTDEFEFGINASYDDYETMDLEGYLSGEILEGLRARVALRHISADRGWQESITRPSDTLGLKDKGTGRVILDWDTTNQLAFRFLYEEWYDKSDAQAAQPMGVQIQSPFPIGEQQLNPHVENYPYVPNTKNPRLADWVPEGGGEHSPTSRLGTEIDYKFSLGAIKSDWNISESMSLKTSGSIMSVKADDTALLTTGLDVYNADTKLNAYIDSWAVETRLVGDVWDERISWQIGANTSVDDSEQFVEVHFETTSLFGPYVPGQQQNLVSSGPVLHGNTGFEQNAIFINTDIDITDTFRLTLGGRYTEQTIDFVSCSYEPEYTAGVGLNTVVTAVSAVVAAQHLIETGELGTISVIGRGPGECFPLGEDGNNDPFVDTVSEENFAGRAALRWIPHSDATFYASYGRGYKFGGYPVINAAQKKQYEPVKQERIDAYEIGAKLDILDRSVRFNSAMFYYDYTDKQLMTRLLDPFFGPIPVLKNAPKSRVYGAEIEVNARLLDRLMVGGSASYVDSKVEEFISTNFEGDEQDFSGQQFNYAPKWEATATIGYEYPIVDSINLEISVDYKYSGETNGVLEGAPLYRVRSWEQYGAQIGLANGDGRWSIYFWGKNLTDELVTVGTVNVGDTVSRYTAMPRNYGIAISYKYF